MKHSKRRRNGGFVLIVMALAATALLGVLGMAVDVGRMFISKNELPVFSDAGALAAAGKLDGTSNAITKAQAAVATFASPTSPTANAWNLGSTTLNSTNYTLKFAQASSGPWSANPSPATDYTSAQVSVTSASLQPYFRPV